MVKEISLNDKVIQVKKYYEENVNGFKKMTIVFDVTSSEYHDITTLLYENNFHVKVPERGISFKGTIAQYFTSFTNLYEKGQVGEFTVSLLERK